MPERVEPKVGDPNDKQSADQFANHRAGYGEPDEKLQRLIRWAKAGHSMMSGEAALIVAHYEAAIAELKRQILESEEMLRG